jgi:multidrug resistance efflux pump
LEFNLLCSRAVQDRLFSILFCIALVVLAGGCSPDSKPGSVSGTIETDEVRVASRYGGRVEKTLAREGEALKAGQMLVELEAAELRARRALAAAQLAELEAGPRKQEIEAAKHDWEAIAAEAEQARADARRAEELFAQKTISQTEREQASTRARTLEKNVAASRSRYDLQLAGTRPERLDQARAQLADIDAQLVEMKIVAPSDSVLEVLSVKVGDVLAPNREVATLLLPQHTWVRVYVPEPWLGHLQLAQAVKVRVDSEPNRDFPGTIEQIARDAEFTPRNVQTVGERMKQVFGIKIRLDNSEGKLRAGMSADITFPGVPK